MTHNHISMKNLLFTFCFAALALGLQAQITDAYFPVAGDTLRTAIDDQPPFVSDFYTPPGGNQTWNFSSLVADQTRVRVVKPASAGAHASSFPGADLLIEVAGSGENYINVTNEKWEYIGFAGQDPAGLGIEVITQFNPPVIDRHAPLMFFDINASSSNLLYAIATADIPGGIFDQLPINPDSIRLRVAINILDVVDGTGAVTIPGGTYDVLREKRTEYREARLDAKVPFLGWLDITDIALQNLQIPGLGVDTTISHRYWSQATKEPIAILTFNNAQNAVTFAEFKYDATVSGGIDPVFAHTGLRVYPNPAQSAAVVELTNLPAGDYRMQVSGLQGQVLQKRTLQINGDRQIETLDVSALSSGIYQIQIWSVDGKLVARQQVAVQH